MAKPLYLGKRLQSDGEVEVEPFILDGDQLVTHGVVLGMTGSGKTGLSLTLLEELVSQGVPLLLIDPKGDLPNLGLVFPELEPQQFEPWVDPQEAQRLGKTCRELAEQSAQGMREQLRPWGLDSARMETLRAKMDLRIYTPGAQAGIPINLLGTFSRPSAEGADVNELITGTVSSLLSLVGVSADPLRSPEHIVLATIFDQAWSQGQDLTLETVIVRLVDPPFKKVGVFPLNTFYPAEQRMELAMRFNAVLASPGFALWSQGEPLDPAAWCTPRRPQGTPVSLFYLAHLSDAERMFFVSLLLERIVAYSRTLSGTSGLRSLIYFDEVAGYLPHHPGNPPSKRPLLTLMKQARAVGLGVVLATQNPVDIDYKGLANAGTWMIGRMQTAQDRGKVADGLLSAEAGLDSATLSRLFEQLKPRVFIVKTAGSDRAELIHTRQAMSFLRGPLTRADLERLRSAPAAPVQAKPAAAPVGGDPPKEGGLLPHPPVVPKGFDQLFLDPQAVFSARLEGAFQGLAEPSRSDGKIVMRPAIFGELHLRFDEDRGGFVHDEHLYRVFYPIEQGLAKQAVTVPLQEGDLSSEPPPQGLFPPLPVVLDEAEELRAAQKALLDEVFRNVTDTQFVHPRLKLYGAGGESREAFQERVRQAIQERIDTQVAKLHEKYDRQVATLQERINKKESEASLKESQAESRQHEQLWNAGAAVLGFFTGRHRSMTSALGKSVGSALTKNRLSQQAQRQAQAASEEVLGLYQKLEQVRSQLEEEVEAITAREMEALQGIEAKTLHLDRNDIRLSRFGILWLPLTRRV